MHFRRLFESLLAHYGPQGWWPGEGGRFEVMAGAVLVQRTAWRNAERALASLRAARIVSWPALARLPAAELERLIRSAGFYRLKAKRLAHLAAFVNDSGGCEALNRWPTPRLRRALLMVHGIGAETADAILLYAFERRVFVVDAYARRLAARLSGTVASDSALRRRALRALAGVAELNELHALIVAHAKARCRTLPLCEGCGLRRACDYAARAEQPFTADIRCAGLALPARPRRAETDRAR